MITMPNKKAKLIFHNERIEIVGEIDFSNVMYLYQQSLAAISEQNKIVFDFSKMISSNSAGLVLLLEWIKLAKDANKSLQVLHLPKSLTMMAKAANVEHLIP